MTCRVKTAISLSFSANFCEVSLRTFAEKTLGEIIGFYFSPRRKLFRARGAFFLG